jgi:hypothetical protein
MWKLIAVVVLCLALIGGCCAKTAQDGTKTESFLNCLEAAEKIACNPPQSVIIVAEAAIPIIEIAIGALVPGSAEWMTAVTAGATAHTIVTSVQTGVCVGLGQLNNLIAFLESPQAKATQVKMLKRAKMAPAPLDIAPLKVWLASRQ